MKTLLLRIALAALCFTALAVSTAHAALMYSVTVLDTLGGTIGNAYGNLCKSILNGFEEKGSESHAT